MTIKQTGVMFFCVLVVFMGITVTVNAEQNHFKAYNAKSATDFKPITVGLKDQFDKEAHKVKLISITFFANPVAKWHGTASYTIPHPSAHLTWYKFSEPYKTVKRVVKFKNQFGEQKWELGEAIFLVVPTQKISPPGGKPVKFNHFKAYRVLGGDFQTMVVKLKDQFNKVKVKVVKPVFFCNPVQKNNGGIVAPRYHLACYVIEGDSGSTPKSISIANQFGESRLYIGKQYMLCVPTEKLGFEPIK